MKLFYFAGHGVYIEGWAPVRFNVERVNFPISKQP